MSDTITVNTPSNSKFGLSFTLLFFASTSIISMGSPSFFKSSKLLVKK